MSKKPKNIEYDNLVNACDSIYGMIRELSKNASSYLDKWALNALYNKTNPKFEGELTKENLDKFNIEVKIFQQDEHKNYWIFQDGKPIDAICETNTMLSPKMDNLDMQFKNPQIQFKPIPLNFEGQIIIAHE